MLYKEAGAGSAVNHVSKSALVPYTAEQMYALVNDIESYPQFLPWCTGATVASREEKKLTASVSLATGRLKQTFSTVNTMEPGRRIDVKLISGPFRYLQGYWKFEDKGAGQCHISLEMNFEFRNTLLKLTLTPVFSQFMNSLMDSFIRRAGAIYSG